MIRIEGYGINADANSYTVGKIAVHIDRKTGAEVEVLTSAKYYANLQGCIKHIRKQMHVKALEGFDGGLKEAVELLRAVDERFEALIEDVEKE